MRVGTLKAAIRCATNARSASGSIVRPGFGTIAAATSSPSRSCGSAEDRRLVHVGVLVEDGLDLGAVHVLAGAQHHVLGAVLHVDEALVVDAADVAAAQPAVDDRLGGRLGLVPVAADQVGAAEPELADFARRRARGPSASVTRISTVGTTRPQLVGLRT